MLEVLVQVARSGRVYHEEGPAGLQCPKDVLQTSAGWARSWITSNAVMSW